MTNPRLQGGRSARWAKCPPRIADPCSVVKNMVEILRVAASFVPDTTKKYNIGYLPRNRAAGQLAQAAARALKYSSKSVPKAHQWRVNRVLKIIDHAMRRNRMIGRDLSHWLMSVPQPEVALA